MEHCAPMCEDQVDYVTSKFHALQPFWQAMNAVLAKLQKERELEPYVSSVHSNRHLEKHNLGGKKNIFWKFSSNLEETFSYSEKLTYYIVPTGTKNLKNWRLHSRLQSQKNIQTDSGETIGSLKLGVI